MSRMPCADAAMPAGGDSVYFIECSGRISEYTNNVITKQSGCGLGVNGPCAVIEAAPSQPRAGVEKALYKIRNYLWLVPLIHTEFWISAGFALIQPFFPEVASSRGLSAWKYGFVFSAYKVGMLLGSIIAERMLKTQSPTLCYLIGQGGFVLFLVVFGCLYWIQNGEVLLATSIASVIFGGLANNMYLVGMFTVITTKFEDNTGIFIGFLEFLWGSGNMAGSYLGGHLIDVWAYPLPFFVLGVIAVSTFPVIACLRQRLDGDSDNNAPVLSAEEASINYCRLIIDPVFFADMVSLTMVWIILGFNEPTLEPSLSIFDLKPSETGMVYTVQYGSYALGCIIAGIVCHFKGDGICMVLGQSMCTIGFLVIAPAKFIAARRELWNVYACQVLIGFGTSILFISAYSHVLSHVMRLGYPNNIRTNSFVSSCVFSFLVIGAILTPPIAGCIYDVFGYESACLALSFLLGAWVPITVAVWIWTRYNTTASRPITKPLQS